MYIFGQDKAKVGRVNVDIKGKSYRIRFTYPEGKRHEFSIARVTPEGWTTAIKAAQLINRDIEIGDFDDSYVRYSPKHARQLELAQQEAYKEYNLKELWELYKEQNKDRVAKTTQKHSWSLLDRTLAKLPEKSLELSNSTALIPELLKIYSKGTLPRLFDTINAATNFAVAIKKIDNNPYSDKIIQKTLRNFKKSTKRYGIECFEPNEIKAIIAAFYSDEFNSKYSQYKHSWYAKYVEFLALTGCRPEEAIPLTWDDVKEQNNKMFIRFNKAYSNDILLPHTKTYEIRLFPCNSQLQELINSIPRLRYPNNLNLLFPSQNYKHISQNNFASKRCWKRVVDGLVEQGKVEKYLKPYCLRHSFITRLVRDGADIKTISTLAGTSPKTIINHYLAARKDYELPEL